MTESSQINRKKATIAIILIVVAVALIIGVYLWRKGKVQTSADIKAALDQQEEQEFNAGDEELALPGNEFRVGDNKVALRSGTLVKLENAPDVYLIYRGTKQRIASPEVFNQLFHNPPINMWGNILVLPADNADYLNLYQKGTDISTFNPQKLPNGLTIRFSDADHVYSVIAGKLKPYPNPAVFLTRHNWNEVSVFALGDRQMPLDTVPFRFRGGNLVKESDSPNIYWAAGAKKFHIDSPAEMQRWGLRFVKEDGVTPNYITVDPGFLESNNPESNEPMYGTGRNASQFTRNYLPMYLWMNSGDPMVYLFLYDNGAKDLQFVNPQVFLNRFNWSEISYQHPTRHTSPPPSISSSAPVTPLPSGSVKCTVSGHAYYTDWQEIPLTDYARSTYPQGRNKMYEVIRVDGTNNPPRAKMQLIFNIKNITNPNSNQFNSGEQIQVVTDVYFVQGANNAATIENHGVFNLYLTRKDNGNQVAHWLLDENEWPTTIHVGTHYAIHTHDSNFTLPADIDYTQVQFDEHYTYYVGNDDCHWPASGEKMTVFDPISQ